MKTARRFMALFVALALCMTIPVAAFAATVSAGKYGSLTGNCDQSGSVLSTVTYVTTNPDEATLRVNIRTTSGSTTVSNSTVASTAGATYYSYRYPIVYAIDLLPTKATCTHYVVGELEVYNTTSSETLDTSYFT